MSNFKCPCWILPFGLLLSLNADADLLSSNHWKLSGFATVGYTETNKYQDRYFRRNLYQSGQELNDNGFLVDSRIGLQAKAEISNNWEFVSQVVLREQYATNIEDYFDSFFVRYRPNDNWDFTLGRQPFDLFFLSDHRNVSYSYDWVRPPTEFYGFLPYGSFDGIKITRTWGNFDNAWQWNLSVGNIEAHFEIDIADENTDSQRKLNTDHAQADPIYNTELSWQSGPWRVRANFALLHFKQELNDLELDDTLDLLRPLFSEIDGAVDKFDIETSMRYGALGLSWQSGDWKIQTEISTIDADFQHFNGQRAYVHIAKRFGAWLPYATFGYARDNSDDELSNLSNIDTLTGLHQRLLQESVKLKHNQKSVALGLRYDFSTQQAVKVQCDKFYFEADSGSVQGRPDETYSQDQTKTWCSINLDLVF